MSERAIVDLRLWVEAETREEVLGAITEAMQRAGTVEGVRVRKRTFRPGNGSSFEPTFTVSQSAAKYRKRAERRGEAWDPERHLE